MLVSTGSCLVVRNNKFGGPRLVSSDEVSLQVSVTWSGWQGSPGPEFCRPLGQPGSENLGILSFCLSGEGRDEARKADIHPDHFQPWALKVCLSQEQDFTHCACRSLLSPRAPNKGALESPYNARLPSAMEGWTAWFSCGIPSPLHNAIQDSKS